MHEINMLVNNGRLVKFLVQVRQVNNARLMHEINMLVNNGRLVKFRQVNNGRLMSSFFPYIYVSSCNCFFMKYTSKIHHGIRAGTLNLALLIVSAKSLLL